MSSSAAFEPSQLYFTNKLDATAWTDVDRLPRTATLGASMAHNGSQKRLLFARREQDRQVCQQLLDRAEEKDVKSCTRRVALITNFQVENS